MKSVSLAAIAPAILMAVAGVVWAQPLCFTPMEDNAPGSIVLRAQTIRRPRRACLDKDAMDERGQGNWRRYRERSCGPGALRAADAVMPAERCARPEARAKLPSLSPGVRASLIARHPPLVLMSLLWD